MLIPTTHWRIKTLGQLHGGLNRSTDHHTGPVQHDREFSVAQHFGSCRNRIFAACWTFKFNDSWQFDINDLCPEIAWHIDLGWCRRTLGLQNNTVQCLGNAGWVAHFFLIRNHVFKKGHLFNFLKPALTKCFVGGLRGDQKQRRMIPISGLHRGNKICDARAILCHHHRHFAGCAGKSISHHTGVTFMCRIPERDASLRKQI